MTVPELAPRSTVGGIVSVWIAALVAGVAVVVFAPPTQQWQWLSLALAGCLVLAFVVQLWNGRSVGFIQRIGASVLGSLLVLGLVSAVVGVVAILPV